MTNEFLHLLFKTKTVYNLTKTLNEVERTKLILWILVGVMTLGGFARMFLGGEGSPEQMIMRKQLERDFLSAEMGIECGYSEAGYSLIAPSIAVQNYLDLQKASGGEMEKLYGQPQALQIPPLPHIVGKPGKPWTIVLEPSDEQKNIQIFGFGDDANMPLLQKEILCE